MTILAVDPGGSHVGVAIFRGERCIDAFEVTPDELVNELFWRGTTLRHTETIVCEEFRLRRSAALSLVGSTLPTVELIGVLRHYCRVYGIAFVTQPATIKRPTAAQLRHRGVESLALRRRAGGHARDAELHGYRYLFDHEMAVMA